MCSIEILNLFNSSYKVSYITMSFFKLEMVILLLSKSQMYEVILHKLFYLSDSWRSSVAIS